MPTIVDLLSGPWAIAPERLIEIQEIYAAHLRGPKIDVAAIEARIGQRLAPEQKAYTVQEGTVGVLTLEGVIAPKSNLMMQICGGISAQKTIAQLDAMAADPNVRSAAIAIDSPGGSVQLVPAVGQALRRLADAKPTVAVSEGVMASALYWIGSAANAIMISGGTDMVGSIGVVATHSYRPREGTSVTTEITAGKYKRAASPHAPLDTEGRAVLQAQVDEIYRVFLETVAANRGASVADVLAHMAEGRTCIGQQAIDRGLVDGIATLDEVIAELASDPSRYAARRTAKFAPHIVSAANAAPPKGGRSKGGTSAAAGPVLTGSNPAATHGAKTMTPEQLAAFAAEHPEAAAALQAQGANAERARIQAIRALAVPGHEALIETLAFKGDTTPGQAAIEVLAAVRNTHAAAASAHFADAPAAAPASSAPDAAGSTTELTRQQQVEQARAHAAEKGVDFLAAWKALGFPG